MKIKLLWLWLAAPVLLYGGAMSVKDLPLPRQIGDWKAEGNDQIYDRQTLFKYIDGGAELYLAYDFRQVLSRKFSGPSQSEIVLDIYDMGSSQEAFGIFSSEREDAEAHIGQGSEFGGGLLRFWKDHFFVSILASGGGDKADTAVLEMGKTIADFIPVTGPEPDLLTLLPPTGLDKRKIRFFHLPLQLGKHYFVADKNILELNPKTNGLLAEYPLPGSDPLVFLLIQYETNAKAKKAYNHFLKIYMPEAIAGLAQMENKKWTMARCSRDLVGIVFEAPDREQAAAWLSSLNRR